MDDKEKFEKEALAEFIELTGIPKERIFQYNRVNRVEFFAYGETYELKNPGLVVMLDTGSLGDRSPVLYFPKKHQDISEPVKDQLPCEDTISRKEAIDTIRQLYLDLASQKAVIDILKVLPSVTPQKPTTKNCRTCRNQGSHNGVCDICKKYSCWTEIEPQESEEKYG